MTTYLQSFYAKPIENPARDLLTALRSAGVDGYLSPSTKHAIDFDGQERTANHVHITGRDHPELDLTHADSAEKMKSRIEKHLTAIVGQAVSDGVPQVVLITGGWDYQSPELRAGHDAGIRAAMRQAEPRPLDPHIFEAL